MKKLEELARTIQKDCEKDGEPITWEEALEMAQMEIGAKEISREAHTFDPNKPKKKREVKFDDEKVRLIKNLATTLKIENLFDDIIENIAIANPQKEISFRIGENDYSISLIRHRKTKGEKK